MHVRRLADRAGTVRPESLAGWVFADVLLVFFLVGMGSQVAHFAEAEPTPTPTVMKPTTSPIVVGMEQEPHVVTIDLISDELLAGSASEERRLRKEIGEKTASMEGRQAGMVLIWGFAPRSRVEAGIRVAKATSAQLERANPDLFTRGGAQRCLWKTAPYMGKVRLEIYLFSAASQRSGTVPKTKGSRHDPRCR